MNQLRCTQPACGGTIAPDGYCDTCGTKFRPAAPPAASAGPGATSPSGRAKVGAPSAVSRRTSSGAVPATRPSGRTGASSARARVGAGLVTVEPTPIGDPSAAIMSADKIAAVASAIPEDQRFCSSCQRPVGRATADRPGRTRGFCGNCRTPFDFATNAPSLSPGELAGDQYEIAGCLAHGGMGWIYLAKDTAVSNRWVVLKGLLSSGDEDAIAAALAERQYLARVEHGNIVRIYNFVRWRGAGYIVMEYVGGESLNAKLKRRRAANSGVPDPLPVTDAIAYMLAVLPALSHLHSLGLLYNDLKPANVMALGDDVKLIDLGAVIRADDPNAIVFGTDGFQAPEVASAGPSVASDVYTVGRTLAVLILNFVFHDGPYRYTLPTPADEPLFAEHESLYRFLLKATAEAPPDRFESIDAAGAQLIGVLREIVARSDGRSRPATSALFSGDQLPRLFAELGDKLDVTAASAHTLPVLLADPADPAAAFVANMPNMAPGEVLRSIGAAIEAGSVAATPEVELRRCRALIESGQDPTAPLDALAAANPWEWRVDWYRGLHDIAANRPVDAANAFSRVWTEVPGELAPKLALALCAERAGDYERASELYDLVATVDDSYVSALFGLARCRRALDDEAGAIAAFERVPAASAVYIDAQIAATRQRLRGAAARDSAQLATASATIDRLLLDPQTRAELQTELLEAALANRAAASAAAPAGATASSGSSGSNGGDALADSESELRFRLEAAYRELARAATDRDTRIHYVDRANAVRPFTLI